MLKEKEEGEDQASMGVYRSFLEILSRSRKRTVSNKLLNALYDIHIRSPAS